jgi:hypothetical protein
MLPAHRAQLAAAIGRFQAELRRLARTATPRDRDRLLPMPEPARARSAGVTAAGTRKRAAVATRKQPAAGAGKAAAGAGKAAAGAGKAAAGAGKAAAGTRAGQGAAKRGRKPAAAGTRGKPAAAATAAIRKPPAEAPRTEQMTIDWAGTDAGAGAASGAEPTLESSSPPAVGETSQAAAAETRAPATGEGARGGPSAVRGGKRVRWTRESIIDELARWMVAGTAVDSSFVRRHGPPGLVPAALRIFGRFDAALNVAGLHVAKLYPDGPPAR